MAQTLSFKEMMATFYRATNGIQKGQYRYKHWPKRLKIRRLQS